MLVQPSLLTHKHIPSCQQLSITSIQTVELSQSSEHATPHIQANIRAVTRVLTGSTYVGTLRSSKKVFYDREILFFVRVSFHPKWRPLVSVSGSRTRFKQDVSRYQWVGYPQFMQAVTNYNLTIIHERACASKAHRSDDLIGSSAWIRAVMPMDLRSSIRRSTIWNSIVSGYVRESARWLCDTLTRTDWAERTLKTESANETTQYSLRNRPRHGSKKTDLISWYESLGSRRKDVMRISRLEILVDQLTTSPPPCGYHKAPVLGPARSKETQAPPTKSCA